MINGGTIEFAAASDANVSFEAGHAGTLQLDASALFTGQVAGFAAGDTIDLRDVAFGDETTLRYEGDASGGALTVDAGGTFTAPGTVSAVGNVSLSADLGLALTGVISGGTTLLQRLQQFASNTYGPPVAAGLAAWHRDQKADGRFVFNNP